MTHGGMGYAKEFHVERYLRESLIVADRADHAAPHPQLHRREGVGLAEVLLRKLSAGPCWVAWLSRPARASSRLSRHCRVPFPANTFATTVGSSEAIVLSGRRLHTSSIPNIGMPR